MTHGHHTDVSVGELHCHEQAEQVLNLVNEILYKGSWAKNLGRVF